MDHLYRIFPAEGGKCSGSKVLTPNGEELKCVRRVTLTAEPNSLWHALIEVNADPGEIKARATIQKDTGAEALEVADVIVLEVPRAINADQHAYLQNMAEKAWPGRKVVVLSDGIRVSRAEDLKRLEAKLDEVLAKMARKPYYGGGPG